MYYYASIPYSADFMKYLGYKIGQYCNALINPRKKCLVLDLDNTLWGGIIGEDNLDGILLGTDYPGNVYVEIQKIIKEISKTGVLLAINSKNNFGDVKAVFDKHPNSVLKLDDFSAYRINWNEKHINMVEIATELNIGTDSFVFIDDNPVEIGAINHLLPEVATIQFDKNNSINNLKLIRDMDFFFSLKITSEDMAKTDHYKQQATRKQLFKSFENVDEFYESLNIRISVNECNSFSISRVSQLTMKTNQFNLTTKRYTESDIKKFQNDNKTHIYYLSLKDKIGDYGIVGVFIGFERNNEINIDTFLMSCRVIGRQIEKAFIGYLMDVFHSLGFRSINGLYIETKKNSIVKEFYKDIGFIKNEDNWSKDLSIGIKIPAWLTIENE